MSATLEQFVSECRTILNAEPGPSGRRKICMRLEELLRDAGFVSSVVNEETSERHILYEDPALGFCVLAHSYKTPKTSPPHDHGPSWAIYGQAKGET
jgi:predicted metal-dependent enzyme (double-stranded beta helix superfamily)